MQACHARGGGAHAGSSRLLSWPRKVFPWLGACELPLELGWIPDLQGREAVPATEQGGGP